MRPIEKYIRELMEKKGFKSYRQLSLALGMGPNEIFHIMSKGVTPSDDLCKKLAELSADPAEKVLLLAQISKAPEATRPAWERIFQAMAFTAVVAVMITAAPSPAQAEVSHGKQRTLDIMSNSI